jgi:hypothetical protein
MKFSGDLGIQNIILEVLDAREIVHADGRTILEPTWAIH